MKGFGGVGVSSYFFKYSIYKGDKNDVGNPLFKCYSERNTYKSLENYERQFPGNMNVSPPSLHLCENRFSALAAIKMKYQNRLNVTPTPRYSFTNLSAGFQEICHHREAHTFH